MTLLHRVRSAAAFVAGLLVVFGVVWASEAMAASGLEISSPAAGQSVSGMFEVEGSLVGEGDVELSVSLAPQVLGDCGPAVLERTVSAPAGEGFSVALDGAVVEPGLYCLVVLVDGGRLSAAVGDVRVDAPLAGGSGGGDGAQLPTLALPGEVPGAAELVVPGAEVLIPTVVGGIAAVCLVVLSVGLAIRRHRLQDS